MRISYKIAVIFIFLSTSIVSAQEKLKGNKIVITDDRGISDFTKIEIIDNVNVNLTYNEEQSVAVETDSNLQSAILTELVDGTLTIRTSEVIGRKKALNIHLKVNKKLQEINTYNNAKVYSKNSLKIDSLVLNSFDNSLFNLKLNSKNIEINGRKSSKLKFEILTDIIAIRIEESCNLKGTIDTKEIQFISLDKATAELEGSADDIEMEASGNTSFKGEDFQITNAIIKANNSVKLYVNISDILELYSNNSSELHLFSNPKITLHEFYDKALIRKRELH